MIEIGRLILKIAGRDAGKKGVVIDLIDDNYVMVDGQVRRKKCNVVHIEPLSKKLDIKKKASHEDVVSELKKIGIEVKERKKKEQKERPRKQRKKRVEVKEVKKVVEKVTSVKKEKKENVK